MKLLHLSDIHLGKSLGDFDLIEDQKYILEEILKIAEEKEVNGVLIAGDVFDKSVPSEAAVNLLDWFLKELVKRKLKTFMISGNHDSDDRLNYGSSLFELSDIYVSAKYDGILYKKTFADEFGKINIYLLPFVKASLVRHFFPDEEISSYEDAVRLVLKKAEINKEERNIIVCHQFVAGTDKLTFSGSESVKEDSVGTIEMIGFEAFEDFDYVALGHIHKAQRVGRDEIRYCGSPLKYSLSEANGNKSVPLVTVLEKGNISVELIPLKPLRDLRHIKGGIKDLLDAKNVTDPEDFIYVTLTDNEMPSNVMGIFQQTYKNTVKIDYENDHTKEIDQVDISDITQNKSFEEVIGDFYKLMFGSEIDDEELEIMRQVAREAGVIDETD